VAHAASPKGKPASAQAVAPGLDEIDLAIEKIRDSAVKAPRHYREGWVDALAAFREQFAPYAEGDQEWLNRPMTAEEFIEQLARDFPGWKWMFGHEVYDPIPGTPGQYNHRELIGEMIWWATGSKRLEEERYPKIISAERHLTLGSALAELRAKMEIFYREKSTK
jgi:hypothetical protein